MPPSRREPVDPAAPLTTLPGIGPKRAQAFAAEGLDQVSDLFEVPPIRYQHLDRCRDLSEVTPGEQTVRGRLSKPRLIRRGRRRTLLLAELEDPTGRLRILWMNQPYLLKRLETGREYVLHGRVAEKPSGLTLLQPRFEPAEALAPDDPPRPIYPALGGLGGAALGRLMGDLLERLPPRLLPEPLPARLLEGHGLPSLGEALSELHQPPRGSDLEALESGGSRGHQRLAYGALLDQQLVLERRRRERERQVKPFVYTGIEAALGRWSSKLPFTPTRAQSRAILEVVGDLQGSAPMHRLLQGDVGSGKTLVALAAMTAALAAGHQVALMAPTELLAEQHDQLARRLLDPRFEGVLLSRSSSDRQAALKAIAQGRARWVIGTHALIQTDVRFQALALVIVDEQHRFGVEQRQRLTESGRPDVLVMTATPIPRSLALTHYGDLEVSILDELPPGRAPIATELLPSERRKEAIERVAKCLAAGERAYIVLPFVDVPESGAEASLEGLGKRWLSDLSDYSGALLHGRLPVAERRQALERFSRGELDFLVATTVVEVGLDVPEATLMVIEQAERFGLAQLHQLRGRVGRGRRPGACLALHGEVGVTARARLEAFRDHADGFLLAEMDLAQRGPGALTGERQSGFSAMAHVASGRDTPWLERARADAPRLLDEIEQGQHPELRRRLERRVAKSVAD